MNSLKEDPFSLSQLKLLYSGFRRNMESVAHSIRRTMCRCARCACAESISIENNSLRKPQMFLVRREWICSSLQSFVRFSLISGKREIDSGILDTIFPPTKYIIYRLPNHFIVVSHGSEQHMRTQNWQIILKTKIAAQKKRKEEEWHRAFEFRKEECDCSIRQAATESNL